MSENILKTRILHAYKTEEEWKSANPVLLQGELAYSSDKHQWKTGDGVAKWSELPYDKSVPVDHNHDKDYVKLTGGTLTGGIAAPDFSADNYVKTPTIVSEGNDNTYYHRIDLGRSGNNKADFYEYGGEWNFYKNTSADGNGKVLVGSIKEDGFHGNVKGNADTSNSATNDSANQKISSTYIKNIESDGRTVTFTKGDGNTDSFVTQDTTYAPASFFEDGLMSKDMYRDIKTYLSDSIDGGDAFSSNTTELDKTIIDTLFTSQRTGKIYGVKIPKFAVNPTTKCEKLYDNAGLVCQPSTDTIVGIDDYSSIPLFKWYNCNYVRDEFGHATPTAIEGIDKDYSTEGSIDVGVIQMAPYIKWDNSNKEYALLCISDSPHDGYVLWDEANSNETDYPYVIHSKYFSGLAADKLLRSQPNLKPERFQSYNNIINNYLKKGVGYFGAREARNTWQIIFMLIKYATKSSQEIFAGCTSYNFQFAASIQRSNFDTYFPVTKSQANSIIVGSSVSVGYGVEKDGAINNDRGGATTYKYANNVKVLKIEDLDDNNCAVYLDIDEESGFNTMSIALSDTLSAPIILSSMHWYSGTTDRVIGKHDGSIVSNTNGKYPYRVQGVEYAIGGYFVASDVVMDIQNTMDKNVLVCPKGVKREKSDSTIRSKYNNIGVIPGNNGVDFWIGDFELNTETCVTYPSTVGSGNKTGVADRCYVGGTATSGTREYLRGGDLWFGSDAGSSYLYCWAGLGYGWWDCVAAD